MARRTQVLVSGFSDEGAKVTLCDRLWAVGLRAFPARDAGHAVDLLHREGPFRIAAVCSTAEQRPEMVSALRAAEDPERLRIVLVGARPPAVEIETARQAGANFGLWDPFHDSELRFVMNQAGYDATRGEARDELRVPTQLSAFVHVGGARKPAGVYNLSLRGAYLETPRPNGAGTTVEVELLLCGRSVHIPAEVVSTNVPGNLRRANRPIGMGVRFLEVDREAEEQLAKHIETRIDLYKL